ncbi:MAG: DUF2165 family protein, partial [Actinomycetia bacterium]|nr:DUF2165 family protein [Actinomycetes bacterium]
MVAAAQPEAVEAGVGALHAGGNAVDAAIACALVAGVVDPQMCGIAGFGNAQLYLPDAGVHTCVDFHGTSPAATRPDMWEHLIVGETRDGFGFLVVAGEWFAMWQSSQWNAQATAGMFTIVILGVTIFVAIP